MLNVKFQGDLLSFMNFYLYKKWYILVTWVFLTMEQMEILRYFNSKCENESTLVVKTTLWCTRWIGNFAWCAMIISTQCKQRAVKCELDLYQVYDIGILQ